MASDVRGQDGATDGRWRDAEDEQKKDEESPWLHLVPRYPPTRIGAGSNLNVCRPVYRGNCTKKEESKSGRVRH